MDRVLSSGIGMASSIESIAIPQIATGSLSLITSSVMITMIARSEKGLSTPYRRIIFALSLCDILQSFALVSGPFALPGDTADSWGIGNAFTCNISGFFLTFGMSTVPKYTCLLTLYYLCRVKYRMSDEEFSSKFEWRCHILISLYSLSFATVALGLDVYNPSLMRSSCKIASSPRGCKWFPELVGECDPIIEKRCLILSVADAVISLFLSLVGIIVIMGMLYWHAYTFNKKFQPPKSDTGPSSTSPGNESEHQSEEQRDVVSGSKEHLTHLSKIYMTEAILQVSCYIGAFCLVYLPCIIYIGWLSRSFPPKNLQILMASLYPIGGVFNMLAYTRPQAASLRRDHPEFSWLQCFWHVLKAGGEKPQNQSRNEAMSISQIEAFSYVPDDPFFDAAISMDSGRSFNSAHAFNGRSLSYGRSNVDFNPEKNWSYVKGGSNARRSKGKDKSKGKEDLDRDLSISQSQDLDLEDKVGLQKEKR